MKTKNTIHQSWIRRSTGVLVLLVLCFTFTGQAQARVLFQDDDFQDVMSTAIRIGSNDAGVGNTAIQFGADGTASENGNITWNTGTNKFGVDHTVDITGGLTANGAVDLSGATSTSVVQKAALEPGTCTTGQQYYNTATDQLKLCTATNVWTVQSTGTQDFEAVYGSDSGKNLDISAGATDFTITTGANNFVVDSSLWNVTSGGALDAATITSNGALTATGTTNLNGAANLNGTTVIGDNGDTVTVNSSDWDISATGDMTGIGAITADGNISQTGATTFGTGTGAVSLNGDTTVANGKSFTANGTATIGDNGDTVTVNSSDWDISATGDMTGIGAITADGNFSQTGATTFGTGTGTVSLNGNTTVANGKTFNANGTATIGDGGDTVEINSSSWDISTTGAVSGLTGLSSSGTVDFTAGMSSEGGTISLNNSSGTNTTSIGTGTTTGAVTIGGGSDTVQVNSSNWKVSTAGVASGLTGLTSTGTVNLSGTGSLRIRESANPATSAACTTLGEVIMNTTTNRMQVCTTTGVAGSAIWSSGAPNVDQLNFFPEYPDAVLYSDGTNNTGTMSSDFDNTNTEHYYRWTSNNATLSDMDIKFRYKLPADYRDSGDLTFRYRTGTTNTSNNKMDVTIRNSTDATECGTSTGNNSANAWATGTITAATITGNCTGATALDPGDIVEIDVKLYDRTGGTTFADVGYVNFAYLN